MSNLNALFRQAGALVSICLCGAVISACSLLSGAPPLTVADLHGLARVPNGLGAVDFIISSGSTADKLPGARIGLVSTGGGRLVYAEDPTGAHLPLAAPLMGEVSLRRVILAPRTTQGYNITTAQGDLDPAQLQALGILSEKDVRSRLDTGLDRAVLIYFYNPAQPLALTGASLEAYATPFANVTVLKAGGEPRAAKLALVIVGLERTAYDTWANILVDRFLAGRIGQPAETNLADDLTFDWAYPTYSVTPAQPTIDAGLDESITLHIGWRSANPDPPAPWSFSFSSDNKALTFDRLQIDLKAGDPPQSIKISIHREGLAPGAYSARITLQPFSATAGLIDQASDQTITFLAKQQPPTPTPGPPVKSMTFTPQSPHTGDTISIQAAGFKPGEHIQVDFFGAQYRQSDTLSISDAQGNMAYKIELDRVPPGEYTLHMVGIDSAITGTAIITVAERPPDAIVNTPELNLRLEPFPESPVLEVLVNGDKLQLLNTNYDNSWVKVLTAKGSRGWVQTRLLTINIDLKLVPWDSHYPAPK
jgi:hypothetical protein